jgi:hypothetical protein
MLVRHLYKEVLHVVLVSHHALQVIKEFMEVVQKEILSTTDYALGIALQVCDIQVEEMHRCFIEYDSFKLKQDEIEAMLDCFLDTLRMTNNP